MRKCVYCGRWFKNKQAVRAHLRHCEEYRIAQLKRMQSEGDMADVHKAIPDGKKFRFHPHVQMQGLWRDVLNVNEVHQQYCPKYGNNGGEGLITRGVGK